MLAMTVTARAQHVDDSRCKNADFVAEEINSIARSMQKNVADAVQAVPPSDIEYIRQEKQIFLKQRNENRFNLLTSSPHYWALQFHDDYKIFSDSLRAASSSHSTKEQALYLAVALSRLIELKSSAYDYLEFDRKNSHAITSKETRETIYFIIPAIKFRLTEVLQCAINQL